MVSRDGRLVQVRGDTHLRAGDEVLALAEDDDHPDHLFEARRVDASPIRILSEPWPWSDGTPDAARATSPDDPDHRSPGRRRQPRHLDAWSQGDRARQVRAEGQRPAGGIGHRLLAARRSSPCSA
jgi:hypothetical protein